MQLHARDIFVQGISAVFDTFEYIVITSFVTLIIEERNFAKSIN
jgi:hypothetical protein